MAGSPVTIANVLEARLMAFRWLDPGVRATAECVSCEAVATLHFAGPHAWADCSGCGQIDILSAAKQRGWVLRSDIERLLS